MFVAVVFVEGRREHRSALREALVMHARTTREKEPRCRRLDVSIDPVDDASFLVYALFDDEAAYHAHQETQHFSDFMILVEPWVATNRVLTWHLISDMMPSPIVHPGGHA
jgi:quinol monooxygenase YgiN